MRRAIVYLLPRFIESTEGSLLDLITLGTCLLRGALLQVKVSRKSNKMERPNQAPGCNEAHASSSSVSYLICATLHPCKRFMPDSARAINRSGDTNCNKNGKLSVGNDACLQVTSAGISRNVAPKNRRLRRSEDLFETAVSLLRHVCLDFVARLSLTAAHVLTPYPRVSTSMETR